MINKMIIKGETNVAGVYQMETLAEIPLYNGSSIEVGDVLSRHLWYLKRGKYMNTNKRPLQLAYDRGDLVFKVIHISAYNNEVRNMTTQQKEDLQKALGVIEQFNIELNKTTVCNKVMKVTKSSSSPSNKTSWKRHDVNRGSKNPNNKHDTEVIANILYLKEQGIKPKKIVEMLLEHDINIKNSYISRIGVDRWIYIQSVKPTWYVEVAK